MGYAGDATARRSQIGVADFSETHEFVTLVVAGIAREEERHVGIAVATFGNACESAAQALRLRETHNPCLRVEVLAVAFPRELVQQPLRARWRRGAMARKKLAPEHRQKAIGSKTRRQQQPEA